MSKKIKVRFHLGKGINYMKWKVQFPNGHIHFYGPDHTQLVMTNCILKNSRSTALKIMNGEHKTVCAWVLCDEISISREDFIPDNGQQVKYNPRVLPFWNKDGVDMDGSKINKMYSIGNKLNIL